MSGHGHAWLIEKADRHNPCQGTSEFWGATGWVGWVDAIAFATQGAAAQAAVMLRRLGAFSHGTIESEHEWMSIDREGGAAEPVDDDTP